jgi:Uma2 family endonuclease
MTTLHRYTPEEYLARERNADLRSEYIDGRIIAIAPGESRPHNLIVSALPGELGQAGGTVRGVRHPHACKGERVGRLRVS